jgi:TolA-binding protein
MLNPRHYLGNAYLKAERYKEAREVYLEDLRSNNENGWALFGLYQALRSEGKKKEAEKVLLRFKKAFAGNDIELPGSVF